MALPSIFTPKCKCGPVVAPLVWLPKRVCVRIIGNVGNIF